MTRFLAIDGCTYAAVAACLARMCSNPERVMARPAALGNSSGHPSRGRIASHALNVRVRLDRDHGFQSIVIINSRAS